VAVVNPWVGEEVLALFAGSKTNMPTVFAIGEFDGYGSAIAKDMVDEYGPRAVIDLYRENTIASPFSEYIKTYVDDPVQVAQQVDRQDLDLLLLPPSEYGTELDAFIQHVKNDGVICGWGDRGVLQKKFEAVGIGIPQLAFWSVSASTYKNALQGGWRPSQRAKQGGSQSLSAE
jgi:hypothetical protein